MRWHRKGFRLYWRFARHVIVVNDGHLKRLAQDYVRYYHADRTHDCLDKDTPQGLPENDQEFWNGFRLGDMQLETGAREYKFVRRYLWF